MTELIKHEIDGTSIWFGTLLRASETKDKQMPFVVRPLFSYDAAKMGELSSTIYQNLKEDEKCFIHQHDSDYFKSIFNQKDVMYIGVFYNSELIAMSYLRICRDSKTFASEIPLQQPLKITPQRPVASFGGDCVHPNFRGNRLNQLMINFRLLQAKKKGCIETYSIIDRHNHWNMTPYFNNSFCMFASSIDPADDGQIAIMRHFENQQLDTKTRPESTPFHHFDKIDDLLKRNFVAYHYNPRTQHLVFARPIPIQISHSNKFLQIISAKNRQGEHAYV